MNLPRRVQVEAVPCRNGLVVCLDGPCGVARTQTSPISGAPSIDDFSLRDARWLGVQPAGRRSQPGCFVKRAVRSEGRRRADLGGTAPPSAFMLAVVKARASNPSGASKTLRTRTPGMISGQSFNFESHFAISSSTCPGSCWYDGPRGACCLARDHISRLFSYQRRALLQFSFWAAFDPAEAATCS